MSNNSINAPIEKPRAIIAWVWFGGATALKKGEGLCYDADYGTAATLEPSRRNRVERPSLTNSLHFAGVVARDYSAKPGGQFIEIYEPGSVCEVALAIDTVIDTGLVTCLASAGGNGRFAQAGFPGRGSAVPLQTKTALVTGETDGTGSVATDGVTLTGTGFGGAAAGDIVHIFAGEAENATKRIVPGDYVVASVTSATVVVLASSCVEATPDAAVMCSYAVTSNNPRCLAYLQDGPESGLVEWVAPPNVGHASTDTFTVMQHGMTYINGGITIGTGNARAPLADGPFFGARKGFKCMGTLTTNDAEIELDTAGKQQTVVQATGVQAAMVALAFDAANELAFLEWLGIWQLISFNGGTVDAS